MAVEKLDLLKDYCAVYDENRQLLRTTNRTVSEFNAMFNETCDLATLNISVPIKRLMKFYNSTDIAQASFIEVPYETMTPEQKAVFDNFVAENNV